MTLTVHEHPFAAYCWKVLIALYERNVPFEPHVIGDEADRAQLAELWPMAGALLRRADGTPVRGARHRRGMRVPRPVPASLAGLRGVETPIRSLMRARLEECGTRAGVPILPAER
jgi:hypothetical protein